ncbi:MAG TPA: class II aldolase/adducin family protein [Gemmatimonadaceae bacterium]|nr:class II aldolase/adducin family protein [Gemmatimonadaceae bacterium]
MIASLAARREIVTVCKRLYDRGLIAGAEGNVSVRLAPDRILVTPSGMSKTDVAVEDLVEVEPDGTPLRGNRRPSSEIAVHLRIYARRADVTAVVHAHPPVATGFAVAGEGFSGCVLPEMIFQVGWVPLVPYDTPGTEALADRFEPYLDAHEAFLMANHGAITVGPSLELAHQRMESLEHAARILFTARLLGRVNELTAEQVAAVMAARERAGIPGAYPGCHTPDSRRREHE